MALSQGWSEWDGAWFDQKGKILDVIATAVSNRAVARRRLSDGLYILLGIIIPNAPAGMHLTTVEEKSLQQGCAVRASRYAERLISKTCDRLDRTGALLSGRKDTKPKGFVPYIAAEPFLPRRT